MLFCSISLNVKILHESAWKWVSDCKGGLRVINTELVAGPGGGSLKMSWFALCYLNQTNANVLSIQLVLVA